ncbi:hypothetical protein ACFPN7_09810 [Amycolatopsis halotolerans]|uniref:hypothetical protein n=1 Tax=Amycolatopsis halotolerans TaxID=330083 RepID=UPI00361020EC
MRSAAERRRTTGVRPDVERRRTAGVRPAAVCLAVAGPAAVRSAAWCSAAVRSTARPAAVRPAVVRARRQVRTRAGTSGWFRIRAGLGIGGSVCGTGEPTASEIQRRHTTKLSM